LTCQLCAGHSPECKKATFTEQTAKRHEILKDMRKMIWGLALGTPLLYLLILLFVLFMQSNFIFFPGKLSPDYAFAAGEEVFIHTADQETINGLFFGDEGKKVILYFHGNAGDLSSWQHLYEDFSGLGVNFLIIDYRGYGKSTGKITEEGLYLDGKAAYDFLVAEKKFSPEDIIIYGRSIGSGIAVETASKNKTAALILESPFNSLRKFIMQTYPFLLTQFYLRFNFENDLKINNSDAPLLIIHGSRDEVIPLKYGVSLFESRILKKEFILIEGGTHNNLSSYEAYASGLKKFIRMLQ